MLIEGSIIGIATFTLFIFALNNFDYQHAQTMAFATLSLAQLVHAFNNRSTRKSLFQLGVFTNRFLVVATVFSATLQILAVQSSFGQLIFKTVSLNFNDWLLVESVALLTFLAVELKKQLRFRILP